MHSQIATRRLAHNVKESFVTVNGHVVLNASCEPLTELVTPKETEWLRSGFGLALKRLLGVTAAMTTSRTSYERPIFAMT